MTVIILTNIEDCYGNLIYFVVHITFTKHTASGESGCFLFIIRNRNSPGVASLLLINFRIGMSHGDIFPIVKMGVIANLNI